MTWPRVGNMGSCDIGRGGKRNGLCFWVVAVCSYGGVIRLKRCSPGPLSSSSPFILYARNFPPDAGLISHVQSSS